MMYQLKNFTENSYTITFPFFPAQPNNIKMRIYNLILKIIYWNLIWFLEKE